MLNLYIHRIGYTNPLCDIFSFIFFSRSKLSYRYEIRNTHTGARAVRSDQRL